MQEQKNIRGYEVVTWQDVAKQVRAVNSGLADAIDDIDPPSSWKIVKVRYAFGDELLRKGELFVPHNGDLVGINDPNFNPELYSLLSYTSMPIGLNLHSTMELFSDHQGTPIPFSFILPGRIFALWMALDSEKPFLVKFWNMVAGTRSLFFLPKISDSVSFKRLGREFGKIFAIPNSLWDQSTLLKEIVAFEPDPWHLETIYFTNIWFQEGIKQHELLFFLLRTAWRGTNFLRSDMFFDMIYSYAQEEKNIKIDPYLADTIKHLYYLGCGSYPGFVFANSNLAAPIDFIQKVFSEIYALEYSPTLMHLDFLNSTEKKHLFYSLQLPTLLEFAPKSQAKATNLDALYYIQHSMQRLKTYILNDREHMEGLDLYQWAKIVYYQYYHSHPSEDNIIPVTELVTNEPILKKEQKKFNKPFCETNSFMRGLIKLSFNE